MTWGRDTPVNGRASGGTCSAALTNSIQEIVDLGRSELPNIDPEARRDPHSFEKEFALVVAHRRSLVTPSATAEFRRRGDVIGACA